MIVKVAIAAVVAVAAIAGGVFVYRTRKYQHTYKVPKEWLLEFLTSEDYNSITRKSKAHYAMIQAMRTKSNERKGIL